MKKFQAKKVLQDPNLIRILVIFILAFLVRFIYIQEIKKCPLFYLPTMDPLYHLSWAKEILSGNIFANTPFYRAPLYSFLLAFELWVSHINLYFVRIVQILMGSISCVLVYQLSRKMFNPRIGFLAGILACLYLPLVYYDGELLDTSLTVFLNLALLLLLLKAQKAPSARKFLLCGAVLGLSAIARPNILLFGIAVPFWLWLTFKDKFSLQRILVLTLSFAAGIILLVLPVTLTNYFAGKDSVLIAWNGGINFYLGNNYEATGYKAVTPEMRRTWWGGYYDSIQKAEEAEGRSLKRSEVSSYWFKKGFEFIIQNPIRFLWLMLKKIFLFFGGDEISNNQSFYFFARLSSLAKLLLWRKIISFPSGIILPLSLIGLVWSYRQWKKFSIVLIFIFSYTLSVVLFFVCSRYRQPVLPFLIIFSAFAVFWCLEHIKKKVIIMAGELFLGLVVAENVTVIDQFSPFWDAQSHATLGSVYVVTKQFDQAEKEYRESLKYYPDFPTALSGLGYIQYTKENYEESKDLFEEAVFLNPQDEYAHRYLGDIYRKSRDYNRALDEYEKAIELDPEYGAAYFGAGMAYANLGRTAEAIKMWEKVLEYNPGFELAKENIATAKRNLEREQEAKKIK